MLKRVKPWAVLVAALVLGSACTHLPEGVEPVQGFDVNRYLGRWYEIARLDHSFERGLEQVTATYAKRDDGSVDVVNRGFDPASGEWREAHGKAKFVGPSDVAALKVSFFGPFYGGYNVIDLDPDYSLALVVGPTRSYLWILARSPNPPDAAVQRLVGKAKALGYDTSALVYVKQQ